MVELRTPKTDHSLFAALSELLQWNDAEQSRMKADLSEICQPWLRGAVERPWSHAMASELSARGFRPNGATDGFDLIRLLSVRHGNCVEYSVLWMLLGELCGVSLHAVRVPSHMFVRLQGGVDPPINIETMEDGRCLSDDEYAARYSLSKRQRQDSVYLCNLTFRELLGEVAQKVLYQTLFSGAPVSRENRAMIRWVLTHHRMPADLYNSVGVNLLSRRPRFGRAWLQAAYRHDPDFIPVFNNYIQALVLTERYDDVISVCQAASKHVWDHNSSALLNFTKSLLRTGRYKNMNTVFDSVKLCWVSPSVRERFIPYEISHAHLTGDYPRAAELCREWARVGTPSEIGFVWQASAMHMLGESDGLEHRLITSAYASDLVQMFRSEITPNEVFLKHPEQRHLSELYVGEFYLPLNPSLAQELFASAMKSLSHTCFEHLRASRHLSDQKINARIRGGEGQLGTGYQ